MPEQPDDYEPSEADIDMVIEEATGKLIKPANLAAGITATRQRIEQLEVEKAKLLNQLETASEISVVSLDRQLASINKKLAAARERLNHFQGQFGGLS